MDNSLPPGVSRETPPPTNRSGDELLPAQAEARLQTITLDYGLEAEVESRLRLLLLGLAAAGNRAPSTVTEPERAVDTHVADSLAALRLDVVGAARRIADLGAGAGVPGLVLAAALGDAEVWLVESQQSKCGFIAALATTMGLHNAHVVCSRAESWAEGAGAHDLVTARALAAQPVVLEYAAPLLEAGGRLVDWRGARRPDEEAEADTAAAELGLRRLEVRRVGPFEGADERHLHVFEKERETPPRFPRRPGMAAKRPLGAKAESG